MSFAPVLRALIIVAAALYMTIILSICAGLTIGWTIYKSEVVADLLAWLLAFYISHRACIRFSFWCARAFGLLSVGFYFFWTFMSWDARCQLLIATTQLALLSFAARNGTGTSKSISAARITAAKNKKAHYSCNPLISTISASLNSWQFCVSVSGLVFSVLAFFAIMATDNVLAHIILVLLSPFGFKAIFGLVISNASTEIVSSAVIATVPVIFSDDQKTIKPLTPVVDAHDAPTIRPVSAEKLALAPAPETPAPLIDPAMLRAFDAADAADNADAAARRAKDKGKGKAKVEPYDQTLVSKADHFLAGIAPPPTAVNAPSRKGLFAGVKTFKGFNVKVPTVSSSASGSSATGLKSFKGFNVKVSAASSAAASSGAGSSAAGPAPKLPPGLDPVPIHAPVAPFRVPEDRPEVIFTVTQWPRIYGSVVHRFTYEEWYDWRTNPTDAERACQEALRAEQAIVLRDVDRTADPVGMGSFGVVRSMTDNRVIKMLKTQMEPEDNGDDRMLYARLRSGLEGMDSEAHVMSQLRNPQTIKSLDAFPMHDGLGYAIVMPRLSMSLHDYLWTTEGGLSLVQQRILMMQMMGCLTEMHRMHFVHGDIKPSNIFVDILRDHENPHERNLAFVLGDLGAVAFDNQGIEVASGTAFYSPPESCCLRDAPVLVDSQIDIWSMGATLMEVRNDIPMPEEAGTPMAEWATDCCRHAFSAPEWAHWKDLFEHRGLRPTARIAYLRAQRMEDFEH